MTVIGCVWGAHRKLVETMGQDAPSYDWCEKQWRDVLSKRAPAPAALPEWLRMELWFRWTRPHLREPVYEQLGMIG